MNKEAEPPKTTREGSPPKEKNEDEIIQKALFEYRQKHAVTTTQGSLDPPAESAAELEGGIGPEQQTPTPEEEPQMRTSQTQIPPASASAVPPKPGSAPAPESPPERKRSSHNGRLNAASEERRRAAYSTPQSPPSSTTPEGFFEPEEEESQEELSSTLTGFPPPPPRNSAPSPSSSIPPPPPDTSRTAHSLPPPPRTPTMVTTEVSHRSETRVSCTAPWTPEEKVGHVPPIGVPSGPLPPPPSLPTLAKEKEKRPWFIPLAIIGGAAFLIGGAAALLFCLFDEDEPEASVPTAKAVLPEPASTMFITPPVPMPLNSRLLALKPSDAEKLGSFRLRDGEAAVKTDEYGTCIAVPDTRTDRDIWRSCVLEDGGFPRRECKIGDREKAVYTFLCGPMCWREPRPRD